MFLLLFKSFTKHFSCISNNNKTFSNSTENYLEKEFNEYFNKVSKEYDTDIDCFCNKALAHFSTTKEWEDYNWPEKFKNAKFDIDVNIDTISSMLLTKT